MDRHQHRQDFGPKRSKVSQDHPYVVAAAAQDGMELITERALQSAAGETTVGFHVPDHRLDGTLAARVASECRGQPALLPGDVDRRGLDSVAAIHEGPLRARVG